MTQPIYGPCGKRIYDCLRVARKLARRVNDSGRENVQPYHCTRCHGWHLGTPRGATSKKGRARPRNEEVV